MNKILKNEQLFEQANMKVANTVAQLSPASFPDDFSLSLYCECANKACNEQFDITYTDYQKAKKVHNYLVKPEHYLPEFERIVKKTPNYWMIIKRVDKLQKDFVI